MGILLAGMHRSGTSALARFLGLLVGYEGRAGAAFDNVEGHWEDPRLNRILDESLRACDADWASPPLSPLDLASTQPPDRLDRLTSVLSELGTQPWVLKDPRLCLVLQSVVERLPSRPVVVCTFRDPREVAHSIHRRDGYQPEYGLALWEVYTRLLVLQAGSLRSAVAWASYDRLLDDPDGLAERLGTFLAEAGIEVTPARTAEARGSIKPGLRHHRQGGDGDVELSPQQARLLDLVRAADDADSTPDPSRIPPLTPWARAMIETRRPFARMERDNRLLAQRLRRVQPLYRLVDRVRASAGRPVPEDPFDRYR